VVALEEVLEVAGVLVVEGQEEVGSGLSDMLQLVVTISEGL
jgi:hypothetical protein